MNDYPLDFETAFVEFVSQRIGEGRWAEAGRAVFGKNGDAIFRQLRTTKPGAKRRRLKLSEALGLAMFVGKSLSHVCARIEDDLEDRRKNPGRGDPGPNEYAATDAIHGARRLA